MAQPTFVAVGDLLVDVTVTGGRGHDAQVTLRAGGSAANLAVWAAALGAKAKVLGAVGDDLAGRGLRSALEERRVEPQLTVIPEQPSGTFVQVGGDLFVDRGANAAFRPHHLPRVIGADVVALSQYLPAPAARAAAGRASATWVAAIGAPLDGANAIVLNEDEAAGQLEELAGSFQLVCVTRGAGRIDLLVDGSRYSLTPVAAPARDPLGAGDAFAAALLVSLVRGEAPAAALAVACRCGSEAAASPTGWPVVK